MGRMKTGSDKREKRILVQRPSIRAILFIRGLFSCSLIRVFSAFSASLR